MSKPRLILPLLLCLAGLGLRAGLHAFDAYAVQHYTDNGAALLWVVPPSSIYLWIIGLTSWALAIGGTVWFIASIVRRLTLRRAT